MTSNLVQRIWQHRNEFVDGFSSKYHTHLLVYFGLHTSMESAIMRERQMKKWNRRWKLELIEEHNPYWRDLYPEILDGTPSKDTGFPLSRE